MAKYRLTESGVVDTERRLHIPPDPMNRHWQEFQEWLRQGNEPEHQYTVEEYRFELMQNVKSIRKQREHEGIILQNSRGSFQVSSTSDTLAAIQSVIDYIEENPSVSIAVWKFDNNVYATVNSKDLIQMKSLVTDYREKLFQTEYEYAQAIKDIQNVKEQIDVSTGWPENTYTIDDEFPLGPVLRASE